MRKIRSESAADQAASGQLSKVRTDPFLLLLMILWLESGCAPTLPPRPERRPDVAAIPYQSNETVEEQYDRRLCSVIGQHWLNLLAATREAHTHDTVMVSFILRDTGMVDDLQVAEPPGSKVSALLCLKAVQETAPFPVWPASMRKLLGNRRALLFSFQFDAQEQGYLSYWDQSDLAAAGAAGTVFVPGEKGPLSSATRPWRLTTLPSSPPRVRPRQVWSPGYMGFYNDLYENYHRWAEPLMPPVWMPPVHIPPPNMGPGPK